MSPRFWSGCSLFSKKEDIEISGFLASTIAWGNRTMIIKNASKMMDLFDNSPYDFVVNHSDKDLLQLEDFVHRTFNGEDLIFFIKSLKNIYLNEGGMEKVFQNNENADVYYGDTIITNEQGEVLRNRRLRPPANLSWQSMQMGMIVCHQSIFVKKTIAVAYQTKYRISADIDWLIRCLKQAKMVCNTGLVISKFLDGGMSQTNQRKGLQERYEVLNFHFGYVKNAFNHLKMIARLLANKLSN